MIGWKRRLLVAALVSLTATAALAIATLLFGDFGETEGRILATTFSISLLSVVTLPGALLLEDRVARPLAVASLGAAVAAFVVALALIWGADDSETLWRVFGTATAITVALAQVAAMTRRRRGDDDSTVALVFVAATATIAIVAAMAVFAIWNEPDSEWYYRILAALAVLDVFLVLVQSLLRRLGRERRGDVRVVLEGSREQVDAAVALVEGTGVRVRR